MLTHLLYVLLGLADYVGCLLVGPAPGVPSTPAEPRAPSWSRNGWALLLILAGILALSLVLPYVVPPAAATLRWMSPDSLPVLALAIMGVCFGVVARAVWRFFGVCHRNGRAIRLGQREPAWRRGRG